MTGVSLDSKKNLHEEKDNEKSLRGPSTARLPTTARSRPTEPTATIEGGGKKRVSFKISNNKPLELTTKKNVGDFFEVNMNMEDNSEKDLAQIKKRNLKRFKGENRDGYTDQKLNIKNQQSVRSYKKCLVDYQKLVGNKLKKVGLQNEQDLLIYLCDNFLIDKIPDDYEGFMEKTKQKLYHLEEMKKDYSDHMSMKGALAKLSLSIRNFEAQKRKENKYLMGLRKDEEETDELDKIELFKKHKRNKEVIAEKFFIYRKIKDWSAGKGFHLTEQLKKDLEGISDKILKYDKYFEKIKFLNDGIDNLRESIHASKLMASAEDLKIKADLRFADQILSQYQDDSRKVLAEIDSLIQQVNKKFLF